MIFASFRDALAQLGDSRFLRVTLLGMVLALLLLIGFSMGAVWLLEHFLPSSIDLPWIGRIDWIGTMLGLGLGVALAVLSVFLMVPVASAFSGLFLDRVAEAVEARHYPGLPPAQPQSLWDTLIGSVNFLGVLILVNLLALILWPLAGPFVPVLFWAVNGYLLGREYFELAAQRRMTRAEARALRRANGGRIWLAGGLMAVPLTIPVVNLLVPVLGAATFTHLFHRMQGRRPAR